MKISPHEIHIWLAPLDCRYETLSAGWLLLSADEKVRAERLRREEARNRFLSSRVFLRRVLAYYLGMPPVAVTFDYSPAGKPSVKGNFGELPPAFNVSHSGDWVLLGIGVGRQIGVDLESVDRTADVDGIAARYLSLLERETLQALQEPERREAFYRCWTRKEAYVKGRGEGIASGWDKISVPTAPGPETFTIEADKEPLGEESWLLLDVTAPPGYAAALATTGSPPLIEYRHYPPP